MTRTSPSVRSAQSVSAVRAKTCAIPVNLHAVPSLAPQIPSGAGGADSRGDAHGGDPDRAGPTQAAVDGSVRATNGSLHRDDTTVPARGASAAQAPENQRVAGHGNLARSLRAHEERLKTRNRGEVPSSRQGHPTPGR